MKAELKIDLYADLEHNGISRALYLGQSCEPNFLDIESWEEIVERNIGYYIVPGSNTIRPGDMEALEEIVDGLKHAIKLFREKMEQHKE